MKRYQVYFSCTVTRVFDGSSEFEPEVTTDRGCSVEVEADDEREARDIVGRSLELLVRNTRNAGTT